MESLQSDDDPRWNEHDEESSSSGDEGFAAEENDEYYRNRERDPKLYVRAFASSLNRVWPARQLTDPPLRLQHEGLSSHKAIRSSRWAKEKITSKLSGLSLKHKRQEGALRRVEREGISSIS